MGIESKNKNFLVGENTNAIIILPQGMKGPKFFAYPNFQVFLKWNNSFVYAVTAAYLANRLKGHEPFSTHTAESILEPERMIASQEYLKKVGEDVGLIDGILGLKTRIAVRKIQLQLNFHADSWPTEELLELLKI